MRTEGGGGGGGGGGGRGKDRPEVESANDETLAQKLPHHQSHDGVVEAAAQGSVRMGDDGSLRPWRPGRTGRSRASRVLHATFERIAVVNGWNREEQCRHGRTVTVTVTSCSSRHVIAPAFIVEEPRGWKSAAILSVPSSATVTILAVPGTARLRTRVLYLRPAFPLSLADE